MKAIILFLFTTTAFAGPFAEVSLSARQQLGRLSDQQWNVNNTNVDVPTWRMYDVNITKNPYCSIRVGYKWALSSSFDIALGAGHESSCATGRDRGINDVRLTLRFGD